MPEVTIYNRAKEKVGLLRLPAWWDGPVNEALLHQVLMAQQTNARQGSAKVKNRHEVSGSTRKIYRQKGTGRARHGDIKAPLFVGGGRAFGPKPRNYEVRLPQKMRRKALEVAIQDRQKEGRLWVFEDLHFEAAKTKKAGQLFSLFGIMNALVVLDRGDVNAEKSIRNLESFQVCHPESLTIQDILRHEHLVMTHAGLERLHLGQGS